MNLSIVSTAALIIAFLALVGAVAAWWDLRGLNKMRKTFFAGEGGGSLEPAINHLGESIQQLHDQQVGQAQALLQLQTNFNFALQKVGVVRFNPFAGSGGNFSFSIALLNGHNNGLVITSMHGREQNRIYSKKIQDGKSDTQLTAEEQQAVAEAIQTHDKQII